MQSVSSRIWTRVTVSISYDDKHYTTGISEYSECNRNCVKFFVILVIFLSFFEVQFAFFV